MRDGFNIWWSHGQLWGNNESPAQRKLVITIICVLHPAEVSSRWCRVSGQTGFRPPSVTAAVSTAHMSAAESESCCFLLFFLIWGGRNVGPNTRGLIRGPVRRLPAEDRSLTETLMLIHGLLSGDPSGKEEINRQVFLFFLLQNTQKCNKFILNAPADYLTYHHAIYLI